MNSKIQINLDKNEMKNFLKLNFIHFKKKSSRNEIKFPFFVQKLIRNSTNLSN